MIYYFVLDYSYYNHFRFNKDAQDVIDKLLSKKKDLKGLKGYGNFWNKHNKQIIKDRIRPSLSEDALKTLPYIEEDPQYQTERQNDNSKWFNETLNEQLKYLRHNDTNNSKLTTNRSESVLKFIPEVKDSVHVIKNGGGYYVQESLAKSHSQMYLVRHEDVIKARDLFLDKDGNYNLRAAKESTKKELNQSIVQLLRHQAKQKRIKRNKNFK